MLLEYDKKIDQKKEIWIKENNLIEIKMHKLDHIE